MLLLNEILSDAAGGQIIIIHPEFEDKTVVVLVQCNKCEISPKTINVNFRSAPEERSLGQ